MLIGESCAASIVAINKTKEQLYDILKDAVINNDLKLVRALNTFKGIDFDHKGVDGNVVLFIPVESDWNIDMTELLLELGANVNATSNHGWTALQILTPWTVCLVTVLMSLPRTMMTIMLVGLRCISLQNGEPLDKLSLSLPLGLIQIPELRMASVLLILLGKTLDLMMEI